VLRTLRYLNSTMKSARFSAIELVRFAGGEHAAFEARFVAGAEYMDTQLVTETFGPDGSL
jgi:hypothetical protein